MVSISVRGNHHWDISSAFCHTSWHLHNSSDSQPCLVYAAYKCSYTRQGEPPASVPPHAAFSQLFCTCWIAQGSVKHALEPCPLQLCGPSLPCSLFPSWCAFSIHLQCQIPDVLPHSGPYSTCCCAKAISPSVCTYWSFFETFQSLIEHQERWHRMSHNNLLPVEHLRMQLIAP